MDRDVSSSIARLEEQIKALYRLLDEREKQLNIAFSASQKAVDTALSAQQAVNSSQNEFRGALRDQAATFATRTDVDRLVERVQALEKGDAGQAGRENGISYAQALTISVVPILLALAALLWSVTR